MAYLNFSEAGFAAAARSDHAAPAAVRGLFSPIEWLVIALAERDHLSSLRAPGRFARAAAALFGGGGERPLAGARLEALRRVAVLARHRRGAVPAAEMAAFHRAGFSPDQGAALLASVAAANDRRPA
jgi:alkylhydroperoxidase family enzyme